MSEHQQTERCGFDRNASHSEGCYVCTCGWSDRDNPGAEQESITVSCIVGGDTLSEREVRAPGATPRTDAAAVGFARLLVDRGTPDNPQLKVTEIIPADFARTLERENADLREQLAEAERELGNMRLKDMAHKYPNAPLPDFAETHSEPDKST